MKNQSFLYRLLVRWIICSLGLWIAAGVLSSNISYDGNFWTIVWSGFALAVVNAILRPIIVVFSLPAILVTLGLFMVVINGFMVFLVGKFTALHVENFWVAVLAGMIIGLVNYLVTAILENRK